jgi:hypothetical protein
MKNSIRTGRRGTLLAALVLLVVLLLAGQALAEPLAAAIDWWVIAAGGGPASGGNVAMESTLGQPVAGRSGGGDIALSAGYRQAAATSEPTTYRQFLPGAFLNAAGE